MTTHTPGPWRLSGGYSARVCWVTAQPDPEFNESILIAEVAPWNARLIAAAPELLAACLAVMVEYDKFVAFAMPNGEFPGESDCIQPVRDAIAKATGAAS